MEIIFIRHGKPNGATNPKLTSSGFAQWLMTYKQSKVAAESYPPKNLQCLLNTHFIIASDLTRAIHSAYLCLGREPDLKLNQLREIDIPTYHLPFVCRAYSWVFISLLLWFLGAKSNCESIKQVKYRAHESALFLQQLALEHEKIAVFGHSVNNVCVTTELIKLGWFGLPKGNKYWGTIKLIH